MSKSNSTPEPASLTPSRVAEPLPQLDFPHLVMGYFPYTVGGVALIRRTDCEDEQRRYGVARDCGNDTVRLLYEGTLGGPWVGIGAAASRWISDCDPAGRRYFFIVA